MAPEIINGTYTYKTDIWSVGVILYAMITGSHPYEGQSQESVFEKILNEDYNKEKLLHRKCSSAVKDLIGKLLIKEEAFRPSIEEALEHPWFKSFEKNEVYVLEPEIIDSLKRFANVNLLQKEVMFYLAKISKDEEITKLKQIFLDLDKDNTGTLEIEEIVGAIKSMGINIDNVKLIF